MLLVKIDPLRLEALEAVLAGLPDIGGRCARLGARVVHRHGEFRGKNALFASRTENLAELRFRAAAIAVDIGGVEQRDAQIDGLVDDPARRGDWQDAEIVAAEPDDRYFDSRLSQLALFHDPFSRLREKASAGDT